MIGIVDFLLLGLAAMILVPVLLLLMQVGASRVAARTSPIVPGATPKIAVVVPAHNESALIERTVRSITSQLRPAGRLLVVADNCTDDTALVAAGAGAEVTERRDEDRTGKGYALDHGVRQLARTGPPDIVVFVDADCEVGAGAIDRLARACITNKRPAQACYTIHAPASADTFDRIARFAWAVKTLIRPLGCSRLGLPCQLMGTGMAFPWSIVASVNLANGHLAEDQKLSADLALRGEGTYFCQEAQVTSWPPPDKQGKRIQRTRWEHGHLAVMMQYFPRLLIRALIDRNPTALAMALDLSIPPLALLTLTLAMVESATLSWFALTSSAGPVLLATAASGLFGLAIGIAWWRFGRDLLSVRDFLSVPFYCASKVPSFLRFFTKRQIAWVRSPRGEQPVIDGEEGVSSRL